MLTNLQAYAQLAQINITVLTNLQTCTINTDRAEFHQLKHLQRSTFASSESRDFTSPRLRAPGPWTPPRSPILAFCLWKISATHSASDPTRAAPSC